MKTIFHKEPSYAELVSYIERDPNKISLPDRKATRQWASPYNVMDTGDAKLDEANWDWQQEGIYVPPQSRAFQGPQQVQAPAPTEDIGNAFGGGVAQDPGLGPGYAPHGPFQPPPRPPRPARPLVRRRGAPITVDPAPTMFDSHLYAPGSISDGGRAQAVPMDTEFDDVDMDDEDGTRPPHPPPWQGPDATAQQLRAEVQADHVRNVMNHLAWQMQRPQAVPQPMVTDHEAQLFEYGGLPPPPPPPPPSSGGIVNQAQAGLTALGGAAWALSRNQVAGLVNREVVQPVAAALNRHVVEPTVGPAIRQAQQAMANGAEGFAQSVANRVGLGQAAATAEELAPLVAGGAAEAVGAAEAAAMAAEGLGEGFAVGGPLGGVIGLGLGLGGAVLAHQLSETPQHQPVTQAHGDVWHNTASASIPPAAQAQINNSGSRHIPVLPVIEHEIWTDANDTIDADDEEVGRGVRRSGEAFAGPSSRRPRVATFAEDAMVPMGRGIKRSVPLPYRKQGASAYLPKEEQHPLARLGNALAAMPSSMPGSDVPSQMPLQGFSSSEAESIAYPVTKRPPPPPGGGGTVAIRRHALPEAPVMPYDPFADPEYQQVFGDAALEHQIAHASHDPARAEQTLGARIRLAKSKLPKSTVAPALLPLRGSGSEIENGPMAGAARAKGAVSDRSRSSKEGPKATPKVGHTGFDGPMATNYRTPQKAAAASMSDTSRSARRGALPVARPRTVK